MKKDYKLLVATEFILYIFIIIFGLFFKSITPDHYKWVIEHYNDTMVVFPSISERFLAGLELDIFSDKPYNFDQIVTNGFFNAIAFVPFGALLYNLFDEKRIIRATMISLTFSALIEIAQLITIIGGFGIKDVIANTLGGFFGACIMALLSIIHLEKKHVRTLMAGIIFISTFVLAYLMRNAFMHLDTYIDILTRNI